MYLSSTGGNIFQLIVVIAIFIGVLVLAYYATRWIASYQHAMSTGKNFEVIEIQKVAGNHYVMLLRVGSGRFFVVGIGKEEMTMLGELSPDEVLLSEDADERQKTSKSFSEILDRFRSDEIRK